MLASGLLGAILVPLETERRLSPLSPARPNDSRSAGAQAGRALFIVVAYGRTHGLLFLDLKSGGSTP